MTPGPWDVLLRSGKCNGIVARASWNPELEFHEDYIVQTDSGVYGPTLEDAYAISAVPEMLKALKAARERLRGMQEDPILDMIHSALQKAEGKQQ